MGRETKTNTESCSEEFHHLTFFLSVGPPLLVSRYWWKQIPRTHGRFLLAKLGALEGASY